MADEIKEIPVQIPGLDSPLPGVSPIVIVGPNGAGKTRLGSEITKRNSGERIAAVRNVVIPDEIPLNTQERASNEVRSQLDSSQNQPWTMSNEITHLLAKLKAQDSESAIEYRNKSFTAPGDTPPETKITRLSRFWRENFPGREIDFSSHALKARSRLSGTEVSYAVSQMSDGERVAVLLAARVLDARPGLVVVDEPEVHLHPVMARHLWNEFESLRPDCRFLYITHDLPFALSRADAQFLVVRPGSSPQLVPTYKDIPSDVFQSILGAASFSVAARKIVFCEGKVGGERDAALYDAWFDDPEVAVIPVGSNGHVQRAVEVFGSSAPVRNLEAIGIVDRDYWPDDALARLPPSIHVLPVHEVESLLCVEGVFRAVGSHLRLEPADIDARYRAFGEAARREFHGALLHKQILERAKRRVEVLALSALNAASPAADLDDTRNSLDAALSGLNSLDVKAVFDEEGRRLEGALAGTIDEFLVLFPGKTALTHAARALGLTADSYFKLVRGSLRGPETDDPFSVNVRNALKPYLPGP
ncbi:MAG: ATP-dependent endonuclease [Dehalococcoidia bacterium]